MSSADRWDARMEEAERARLDTWAKTVRVSDGWAVGSLSAEVRRIVRESLLREAPAGTRIWRVRHLRDIEWEVMALIGPDAVRLGRNVRKAWRNDPDGFLS